MPTAEARVPTRRASRFLTQLCRHTDQVGAHDHKHRHHQEHRAAPKPRHAECSDSEGVISFDGGRCTLCATTEELILLVEADDQQNLELITEALTTRLQRIGHRDQLALTWKPASAEPHQTARPTPRKVDEAP